MKEILIFIQKILTLKIDPEGWSWKLALKIDLENWPGKLILEIDTENWLWTLTMNIDPEYWFWKFTLKSDPENWPWKLTREIVPENWTLKLSLKNAPENEFWPHPSPWLWILDGILTEFYFLSIFLPFPCLNFFLLLSIFIDLRGRKINDFDPPNSVKDDYRLFSALFLSTV